MTKSSDDGTRAISETAGVATLVLLTVVVTASVGINVLFVGEDGSAGIDAEFDFEYFSSRSALLITYNSGPELRAGNITVEAPAQNSSWADVADVNATSMVAPGDRIQLTRENNNGLTLGEGAAVTVYYDDGTNESVVGNWTGGN